MAVSLTTTRRSSGMHSVTLQLAEPPLSNVASTPTIPPPDPQPLNQHNTSPPSPPHSKKRSSNKASNNNLEIRITNPQHNLSASYPPSTIPTPSNRPTKKRKISPAYQITTPSVAPLPWKPPQKQPYQQTFQLSARQQDTLQHLPPSQLLMNSTAYLSGQESLLVPPARVRKKRAWDDGATDEAWGFDDLGGPMVKKARVGKGKLD